MIHKHLSKQFISTEKGYGIFAFNIIEKDELVMVDDGIVISGKEYLSLPEHRKNLTYQIDEDRVLTPRDSGNISPEWYVNHSCNPNTKYYKGNWYAVRRIQVGEELTHDYALLWANNIEVFEINPCLCGSELCRGKMSGYDYLLTELQQRYSGQFLPYMERLKSLWKDGNY